jgi:pyruvate kinase
LSTIHPPTLLPTTVLLDTKGPEIRTGFFKEGVMDKMVLKKGQTLVLTSDYTYAAVDNTKLSCSYDKLATSVKAGQQILAADGSLVLTVLSVDVTHSEIVTRVENSATIGERKNMNLPGVKVDLPTFTDKDVDDIVNFGIKHGVEFVAASFVRTANDVLNLRKLLADNGGSRIKIICKIENQEGLENYMDILKETDGIMVARGDVSCIHIILLGLSYLCPICSLSPRGRFASFCRADGSGWFLVTSPRSVRVGMPSNSTHVFLVNSNHCIVFASARHQLGMEIPPSKVFLAQKFMIRNANIAGKVVITATQMLESMINNPRPTRAECSDVANAVYDGTDAVMLSGESANSPYFEEAVHIMSRTVCNAEISRNYNVLYQSIRNSVIAMYGNLSVGESVSSSAVKTTIDIKVSPNG